MLDELHKGGAFKGEPWTPPPPVTPRRRATDASASTPAPSKKDAKPPAAKEAKASPAKGAKPSTAKDAKDAKGGESPRRPK